MVALCHFGTIGIGTGDCQFGFAWVPVSEEFGMRASFWRFLNSGNSPNCDFPISAIQFLAWAHLAGLRRGLEAQLQRNPEDVESAQLESLAKSLRDQGQLRRAAWGRRASARTLQIWVSVSDRRRSRIENTLGVQL